VSQAIDVIRLHRDVIDDYEKFVSSFIHISDKNIRDKIEANIRNGVYWPDPLIVFNPSFDEGQDIGSLCDSGILHPVTGDIFKEYRLYKHQVEAIIKGHRGMDYVVTSGTGSGKSLTFMAPVFDYVINEKKRKGIKAIFVYPMNALINSQEQEIKQYKEDYVKQTGKEFPITFRKYTGQEKQEERDAVREELPDIILTNYMMLELVLTRPQEDGLRRSIFDGLKYLVFDELHTYRGRQGADISLLVARIRALAKQRIHTIGTSATMVSGGSSLSEQKQEVAQVASKLLGGTFSQEQIINEYLDRCFDYDGSLPQQAVLAQAVNTSIDINDSEQSLKQSPLSVWLENKVALEEKEGTLVRGKPLKLKDIAQKLAEDSGVNPDQCHRQLIDYLNWLAQVNESKEEARSTYLPFKVHQFISQTGTIYVSLHRDENRIISLKPASSRMVDKDSVPLYPLVFSRTSGHEMVCVSWDREVGRLKSREFKEYSEEEESLEDGYIITGEDIWDPSTGLEQLPVAWTKVDRSGIYKPAKGYEKRLPKKVFFDGKGNVSEMRRDSSDYEGWFMSAPLLFDPVSGVIFDQRTSENTKLTRLGSEGRSTSTTVLSFSILKNLAKQGVEEAFQKLLSFTDSRQDAALQAGHFNDFIKIARLRSAIYLALKTKGPLEYTQLDEAVFDALDLPQEKYASRPSDFPSGKRDNKQAFKDYLIYEALYDLRRSWRVLLPNLVQCALLEIRYKNLEENCTQEEAWQNIPFLNKLEPVERVETVSQVLDYFRKAYALHSEVYLSEKEISARTRNIKERLCQPWGFTEKETVKTPSFMRYETLAKKMKDTRFTESIGPNSALGKYLRDEASNHGVTLKGESYRDFIACLMDLMTSAGWLYRTTAENKQGDTTGLYQLCVDQLIWHPGDGRRMVQDRVKNRTFKEGFEALPNKYFQQVYNFDFSGMKPLIGKEHTGQLEYEDRKEREEKFREGLDSVLFCSPTMELGIDIRNLHVVHMRNVPPTTSNYAQRSGRAGRRGQAALAVTNCSSYAPHDRHFFENQQDMVAGVVMPPKIDLDNRELLTSHLNAVYLAQVGLYELNTSILDLLVQDNNDELPIKPEVLEKLQLNEAAKQEVRAIFEKVVADLRGRIPGTTAWMNEEWLNAELDSAPAKFERALERWKRLYRAAQHQLEAAQETKKSGLHSSSSREMKKANRDEKQAIRQRDILANRDLSAGYSEFYPYRYLASEGFLPGYNFPRLPIRTYIEEGDSGEYVSRGRFMALREFGPGNVIYHKGTKYKIEQLLIADMDTQLTKAKVAANSGYFLMGDEYNSNNCPFTGVSLTAGSSYQVFADLLPMAETRAVESERISCEEEERIIRGYEIDTYFSVPSGMHTVRKAVVTNDGQPFLNLTFIPAAKLVQVNSKWRGAQQEGFLLGMRSGYWKKELAKGDKLSPEAEERRRVMLFTHDTADALYIEPIKALGLTPEGVVSLMYAFKRAIENLFQVESREIEVDRIGDKKHPNIFLYESAEGSLGILSQFMDDKDVFRAVVKEAYKLCRFDVEDYLDKASYDDLLSYYNQRYHEDLNRFAIKQPLELLQFCDIELVTPNLVKGYDERCRGILDTIDPQSTMEKQFVEYLFENGLRLPDAAQQIVTDLYCRPDFYYDPDIFIFCDGTPHDDPAVQAQDMEKRKAIRRRGGQVLVWNYKEKLEDFITKRPDVFKKVR
jgi:superfamily II DNA/RNA helicase